MLVLHVETHYLYTDHCGKIVPNRENDPPGNGIVAGLISVAVRHKMIPCKMIAINANWILEMA